MARDRLQKIDEKVQIEAQSQPVARQTLHGVDRRKADGKRLQELVDGLTTEIGGTLSASQNATVRRVATLTLWTEHQDAAQAHGQPFDVGVYGSITNTIARLIESLPLDPKRAPDDRPERIPSTRIFG
ncbi:hypothetical protein NKI80_18855 [Mesorhizobium sp. M0387]|uniref:hypothetical protein n=1 Tax=Mesorhizobium sp. M0387 TaxID=2956940 RepID=UPI00333DE929